MSTKKETITALLEDLAPLNVFAKPMFGEYGLYCNDIFIGLVCDDIFYLKQANLNDSMLKTMPLAPPYPSAKLCYQLNASSSEELSWQQQIVLDTAAALANDAKHKK